MHLRTFSLDIFVAEGLKLNPVALTLEAATAGKRRLSTASVRLCLCRRRRTTHYFLHSLPPPLLDQHCLCRSLNHFLSHRRRRVTYTAFLHQVDSLSSSIQPLYPNLSKNDVAFILSPPCLHVPVLYFSLLSLGFTISPANPLSSPDELITRLNSVNRPSPPPPPPTNSLDTSPEFYSMLSCVNNSCAYNY
ncbi:unnamed protein product [Fraxinus pennsylvanica]|uniref:AMP-dependent synthetase/ligase domain-containing protein n=1 Tax=Fraxinus pennsylvanica TaxID=56036 RepID=A0AAD1YV66_9LAMI|nr:unnamed protein product [Fraxinus pennsylvanica]